MSAEILRRAAALMRERAEAATPGPWGFGGSGVGTLYIEGDFNGAWRYQDDPEHPHRAICTTNLPSDDEPLTGSLRRSRGNGEHIASWHPDVALAVADLLDEAADEFEGQVGSIWIACALAVARTYLGEQA